MSWEVCSELIVMWNGRIRDDGAKDGTIDEAFIKFLGKYGYRVGGVVLTPIQHWRL